MKIANYISVKCLIDRFWDTGTKDWDGTWVDGTLIDVSTQTEEGNSGRIIPVGIVVLETGAFEAVPMRFITAI